ncbi:MAG: type II secretion system protein M [Gammaproteobacteria bacterium]|nr:type II secretion system protein M [Gammaproteobacteria bacterium]
MNGLVEYWRSLSGREQFTLGLGGIAVIAIIFYVMVWEPWHKELTRLRAQVPQKIETLAWMKQQLKTVQVLRKRQPGGGVTGQSIPLLTIIEQTANKAAMRKSIRRMQPTEEDGVQVWLDELYFDSWLKWIDLLQKRGIDVDSVTVSRAKTNTVSIRATFART